MRGLHPISKPQKRHQLPPEIAAIDLSIFSNPKTQDWQRHISIFSNPKTLDCQRPLCTFSNPKGDKLLTDCCPQLLRLCTGSRYFEALNTAPTLDEEQKKAMLVELCDEVYVSVLEDAIHLVQVHSNDIKRINEEWIEKYGLPKCTLSECTKTGRHYRRGTRDTLTLQQSVSDHEDDALYEFYESIFDRAHNFVFHLFELGLRVDTESLALNDENTESTLKTLYTKYIKEFGHPPKEPSKFKAFCKQQDVIVSLEECAKFLSNIGVNNTESAGVTVDKTFMALRDHIISQRKHLEHRMGAKTMIEKNGKYSISNSHDEQQVTMTDAVLAHLQENGKIQKQIIQRLHLFLEQQAFDSDAMEIDLENGTKSNIDALIQDQFVVKCVKKLIQDVQCMLSLCILAPLNLTTRGLTKLKLHRFFASVEHIVETVRFYTSSNSNLGLKRL